jgi:hypothetical protein
MNYFTVVTSPMQNGVDGFALRAPNGTILELLSYEGSFTVSGITSTDVGVSEPGSTQVGSSLQRCPNDLRRWIGPLSNTAGGPNFICPAVRVPVLATVPLAVSVPMPVPFALSAPVPVQSSYQYYPSSMNFIMTTRAVRTMNSLKLSAHIHSTVTV